MRGSVVLVGGRDIHRVRYRERDRLRLRAEERLVFLCLHPTERFHLDILRETRERFVFVNRGRLGHAPGWPALMQLEAVRSYLGALAPD
jgi:hypothetical protein